MKRLVEILVVLVVVLVAVPASGQRHDRVIANNPHRVVEGGPSHRQVGRDNSFSYRVVASRPAIRRDDSFSYRVVRSPVVRHDNSFSYRAVYYNPVVVDHSFDYGYNYGYSGANCYVRNEVAEPPESCSNYSLSRAEIQEWSSVARDNKARRVQKQLDALDELDQERVELELKQEEAKLKAENQKLKNEVKKLETPPAPVKK